MAEVESKLPQEVAPTPDTDPFLGPVASEFVRYLASIAMTAAATVVAVGVDSKVTIPNLSLVFVVPVIIAGVDSPSTRMNVLRHRIRWSTSWRGV